MGKKFHQVRFGGDVPISLTTCRVSQQIVKGLWMICYLCSHNWGHRSKNATLDTTERPVIIRVKLEQATQMTKLALSHRIGRGAVGALRTRCLTKDASPNWISLWK